MKAVDVFCERVVAEVEKDRALALEELESADEVDVVRRLQGGLAAGRRLLVVLEKCRREYEED